MEDLAEQISIIIFEVNKEQFAINLLEVKEIVQASQIRRLPKSFDFVEGIYNYRGDIIHIVNLKKKLNLNNTFLYKSKKISSDDEVDQDNSSSTTNFIIILNILDTFIGFLVDRIINVININRNSIVSLSPIFQTSVGIEYVKGIIKLEDKPRILIDLSKVLNEDEHSTIKNELVSIDK